MAVSDGEPLFYSVDVDVHYTDGTHTWGVFAPFSTGLHDWERREVLIEPEKPVASVVMHFLFKEHAGLVQFADPVLQEEVEG